LTESTKLRFLQLANVAGKDPYLAYGIGIIAVVIATLIRLALKGHILSGTPFITFFPTVVITTFFCGLWPGVVALAFSAAAAWYFFLPPIYSFALDFDATVALMSFVFLAAIDVAIVALLNITIAKLLEQEKAAMLLVHEVQHRTNNLLTVVQSIAQRSLSADQSLAQGKQLFEARLHALARTHRRLTNSRVDAVGLDEIVKSELEVFSSRTTIQGPPIFLRYEQAQRFALAMHELATNAAKHGALSVPHGKVQIAWTVTEAGKQHLLKFFWTETKGPLSALPMREGFGTILLKTTFPGIRLDYSPDGFRCEFDSLLPMDEAKSELVHP
jgi:two-component sensor histidine kinase